MLMCLRGFRLEPYAELSEMQPVSLEDVLQHCPGGIVAFLSMKGATVLRGVSSTCRNAVSVGCCAWEDWHEVGNKCGTNSRVRLWSQCFPHARFLHTCNHSGGGFSWPGDAMTPPLFFPRLTHLGVWILNARDIAALAAAVAIGTLPLLEFFGLGICDRSKTITACELPSFDLGRNLAGCQVLREVNICGNYGDDASVGRFLEGLSSTRTVTHLSLRETTTAHLLAFGPRLPHLRKLTLSMWWGGIVFPEFVGHDAVTIGLGVLEPCVQLSHLGLDSGSDAPFSTMLHVLPHLPRLKYVFAINCAEKQRPTNQIISDTHRLVSRAPRLVQLVLQTQRIPYSLGSCDASCDVAVRRPVGSACGITGLKDRWAYAILPVFRHHGIAWNDDTTFLFQELACMARMPGPPPHDVSPESDFKLS